MDWGKQVFVTLGAAKVEAQKNANRDGCDWIIDLISNYYWIRDEFHPSAFPLISKLVTTVSPRKVRQ